MTPRTPFEIRVAIHGDALHLLLEGELDAAAASLVVDAVAAAAATELPVVLDGSGLTAIVDTTAPRQEASECIGGRSVA